jgi:hypothetical protein
VYAKNQALALPDGPLSVMVRDDAGRKHLRLVS